MHARLAGVLSFWRQAMFHLAKRLNRNDTKLCQTLRAVAAKKKGITAAALAKGAEISTEQANAVLSPEGKPKSGTLTAVAGFLGVKLDTFIYESDKFYVHFRDHLGLEQRIPATTDKRTSGDYARNIERLVNARKGGSEVPVEVLRWAEGLDPGDVERLVGLGLIDAATLAASQPIEEHLKAWEASLRTKNRTERHITEALRLARTVLTTAGVRYWANLSPGKVESALEQIKLKGDKPLTLSTRNKYVAATKAFARFMKRTRRSQTNPVEDMTKVPAKMRGRRALSRAEVEWLISHTLTLPTLSTPDWGCKWKATGPERALMYTLVCCTGLRAKEIRGLRVRDLLLDDETPHLCVSAGLAKNRTANRVPLPADLVEQLRRHVRMKSPDAAILPVPNKTAWMLRQDMIAARAAWIAAAKNPAEHEQRARSPFLEVVRDTDRFLPFDFHSLRGTASVLLQQAGVPIGFVQRILNHKTPLITIGNYTNPDLGTLAQKMNATPPLGIAAS